MKLTITDQKTGGDLLLISRDQDFDRLFYTRDQEKKYFTIAWNYGEKQTVTIDGVVHDFMPHTILPLMFNQSFYFEQAADIVAWQFNREFYCIIDHDAEVSCVGFLFGMGEQLFISLDDPALHKLKLLLNIFNKEHRGFVFFFNFWAKKPKSKRKGRNDSFCKAAPETQSPDKVRRFFILLSTQDNREPGRRECLFFQPFV